MSWMSALAGCLGSSSPNARPATASYAMAAPVGRRQRRRFVDHDARDSGIDRAAKRKCEYAGGQRDRDGLHVVLLGVQFFGHPGVAAAAPFNTVHPRASAVPS